MKSAEEIEIRNRFLYEMVYVASDLAMVSV